MYAWECGRIMREKASEGSKREKKGEIKGERKRVDSEAKKEWKDVRTRGRGYQIWVQ